MKFDLLGHPLTWISHITLHNIDVAKQIAETEEWKAKRETTAKISVNGIEIPFETVESYFTGLAETLEKKALERYSDVEKEVERRLKERLEEEAQPIIDKLHDLMNVLNDPSELLKPYWERKNDGN